MKKQLSLVLAVILVLSLSASASAAYGSYGPNSKYGSSNISISTPPPAPTPDTSSIASTDDILSLSASTVFNDLKQGEQVANESSGDGIYSAEIGRLAVEVTSIDGKLSTVHIEDVNATANHALLYKAVKIIAANSFETSKSWISQHLYSDGELDLGDAVFTMKHTDRSCVDFHVTVNQPVVEVEPKAMSTSTPTSTPSASSNSSESKSTSINSSSSRSTFTNNYGTATTKCAHSGCNNYIASSGDTAYCTKHSNKCLNCGKYIDGDAMYCLDCIAKSITGSSSNSTFTNKYGTSTTKCAHPGCNNYVATSGDTAYCTKHSNRCLNCGKYIDGDAMYCVDCIAKSITNSSSSNKSSSSSGNSSSGSSGSSGTTRNGYDMPKDGESFADYVKRVDPDLYSDMQTQYNTAVANGW